MSIRRETKKCRKMGEKNEKRDDKRIEMCYAHILSPHKGYNHYAQQTVLIKNRNWRKDLYIENVI